VCLNKNMNPFCNFVINLRVDDTSDLTELWERFLSVDYFGQPCHPIVICFVKVVNGAKGRGTFHKKFKYHKIQYLFVKFLTYGGLILWAHFPSHLVTFIFCSRLTMSLNGLRTKPQDRMIPKRLLTFSNLMSFLDLVCLGHWLVIVGRISATRWWRLYWESTTLPIVSQSPTTLKRTVKRKFQIVKWRVFLRKPWIRKERIGVWGLMMPCRPIGPLTRPR
jgi:hypothetical protein